MIYIHNSVFLDPTLPRVGLSEEEAIKQGYEIKVANLSVASVPRAKVIDEIEGMMKAVVDAKTNKILVCTSKTNFLGLLNGKSEREVISGYSFEKIKNNVINKEFDGKYLDPFITIALKQDEFSINLKGIKKEMFFNPPKYRGNESHEK